MLVTKSPRRTGPGNAKRLGPCNGCFPPVDESLILNGWDWEVKSKWWAEAQIPTAVTGLGVLADTCKLELYNCSAFLDIFSTFSSRDGSPRIWTSGEDYKTKKINQKII